jgi:hypothetical protein
MDLFESEWDIAYKTGKQEERERVLQLIKDGKFEGLIDPSSLTPNSLYGLQSDTWMQGVEYERDRIIKIINDYGSEDFIAELIQLIKGG